MTARGTQAKTETSASSFLGQAARLQVGAAVGKEVWAQRPVVWTAGAAHTTELAKGHPC